MTTENLLCLLCGSLISAMAFAVLFFRATRNDTSHIQRIKRSCYFRGWRDGQTSHWNMDA
jgi:uncharacterized protein (DUF2062 family)